MARTHVGECPALFLEAFDELAQGITAPFARGVLHAVGNDGDHGGGVLVILDALMQLGQRLTHGVEQRRATTRVIVIKVPHTGDRLVGQMQTNGRQATSTGVKREQGQVVLLRVGKIFLRLLDGGDGLVDAIDGHLLQSAHRAALVNDDQVVDLRFLGVTLLSGSCILLPVHTISHGGVLAVVSSRIPVFLKRVVHSQ